MSVNDIPTAGVTRAPRAILLVGGTQMQWESFEMQHNGVFEAGTLTVRMPIAWSAWPFWVQQTEVLIDVYIGFPKDPENYSVSDLTLMMTVRCDEIRLDPGTSTVTLAGRDLTSLFIDNKTDKKFANMTASAIVTQLAKQYPQFTQLNIKNTSELVGNYYSLDHVQMQQSTTLWKLMTYLAQHEGLQCFVLGRQLYFGEFGTSVSDAPYKIQYSPPDEDNAWPTINVERMEFIHDLTISGDVIVRVRSFHGAKNAAYSATAKATRTLKNIEKSSKTAQTKQEYDYVFHGLTQAQCQQKADTLLAQISQHEYRLEATTPGDTVTFPWTPVVVGGTNTDFDTTYQLARISRTFDRRGYLMTMSARTAPTQQAVTLS